MVSVKNIGKRKGYLMKFTEILIISLVVALVILIWCLVYIQYQDCEELNGVLVKSVFWYECIAKK
jgi:cell division protein FtsL